MVARHGKRSWDCDELTTEIHELSPRPTKQVHRQVQTDDAQGSPGHADRHQSHSPVATTQTTGTGTADSEMLEVSRLSISLPTRPVVTRDNPHADGDSPPSHNQPMPTSIAVEDCDMAGATSSDRPRSHDLISHDSGLDDMELTPLNAMSQSTHVSALPHLYTTGTNTSRPATGDSDGMAICDDRPPSRARITTTDGGGDTRTKVRLVMGYRKDCPKCVAGVAGHYVHWLPVD